MSVICLFVSITTSFALLYLCFQFIIYCKLILGWLGGVSVGFITAADGDIYTGAILLKLCSLIWSMASVLLCLGLLFGSICLLSFLITDIYFSLLGCLTKGTIWDSNCWGIIMKYWHEFYGI